MARSAIQSFVDVKQFSELSKLVKTIAWVWRAAKRFLGASQTLNWPKWEVVPSSGSISVRERKDGLCELFLAAQEGTKFHSTKTDRLVLYKE